MSIEFRDLSAVERELMFSEWCKKHGIKRFLFDLDDTISATRPIFREKLSQVYDLLAREVPTKTRDEWKKDFKSRQDRLFEVYSVNPKRWNYIISEMDENYGLGEEVVAKSLGILGTIVQTPLVMLDGAGEGLEFIRKIGMPIGIVTHASRDWTWQKYNWLNLDRFTGWDEVYMVDDSEHKTKRSWANALRFFNEEPLAVAVVGDSPRADINPVWELGVRQCFLVDDQNRWVVHDQPVDPAVKLIKRLDEIPEAALSQGL